jgi:hypothetical protein
MKVEGNFLHISRSIVKLEMVYFRRDCGLEITIFQSQLSGNETGSEKT